MVSHLLPNLTIRQAGETDGAALIALEQRTPVIVGDEQIRFDRSPDYFADSRFHEISRCCLAECGGLAVGACTGVFLRGFLLGREYRAVLMHHLRVDPQYQRYGIGVALVAWLQNYWAARTDSPDWIYTYIDSQNDASLAFSHASSRQALAVWPLNAWNQELSVERSTVDADDARLTLEEFDDAMRLVNLTHQEYQMFSPYSREGLHERLSRNPSYTFADWLGLRSAGRLVAVAGVYDRGAHLAVEVSRRDGSSYTRKRPLAVIDYGFASGYETAMVDLLDVIRGLRRTRERGYVQISVPEESPLFASVMSCSARYWRFDVLGRLPAPDRGERVRSFFADPLYL
jgi:GNAT superfamily N-acetyltransferase